MLNFGEQSTCMDKRSYSIKSYNNVIITKCWARADFACSQTSPPLGASLALLNHFLCVVSSYIWQASSPAGPKWVTSRSIRVVYTLWLGLSLLGHERRVLGEEPHRHYVWVMEERASLCVCDVCVWYIHRWESCSERQRPDYDKCVWRTTSLVWVIAQDDPLIEWSINSLIYGEWDWPVTRGGGHLPGRRSCWKLCWMFRCFVCAVR